jgi:aryl-alcohol dehydrogenase-like predicted oxidoreductase
MRYRLLGRSSGLRLSEFALGVALFGTGWGTARNLQMHAACSTAIWEPAATSSTQLTATSSASRNRRWVSSSPQYDDVVVAMKYSGGAAKASTLEKTGNGRKNLVYSVEQSLKRLKTDYIDLLRVHHSDNVTPTEEILRGLDDLARAGRFCMPASLTFRPGACRERI